MSRASVYLADLTWAGGRLEEGRPLPVGEDGTVLSGAPAGARQVRLAGRALLPGLVNAHSHAFQRLLRGRTEYVAAGRGADDFWSWRDTMYRVAGALSPEDLHVASRQAFVEMALSGVTAVGEFHYLHHQPDGTPYADRNELAQQVLRAALEVGLRITLLRVGYARGGHGVAIHPAQRRFVDGRVEDFLAAAEALERAMRAHPRVRVGLAPHSVRAVPAGWLAALAGRREAPVHVHVAEQPAEVEACVAEHGVRPLELLAREGLLGPHFTAVHGIHLTPAEVRQLGEAGAQVCACPSTEANLGDGVVAADALLAAGVRVCLGSDSQAVVDLLSEAGRLEAHLRLVRGRRAVLDPGGGRPDGLAARLFAAASEAGARSLAQPGGALAPGEPADFFTVDLAHPSLAGASADSLLAALLLSGGAGLVREVAVAGRLVVTEGQHPLAAGAARAFHALCRRLYP